MQPSRKRSLRRANELFQRRPLLKSRPLIHPSFINAKGFENGEGRTAAGRDWAIPLVKRNSFFIRGPTGRSTERLLWVNFVVSGNSLGDSP